MLEGQQVYEMETPIQVLSREYFFVSNCKGGGELKLQSLGKKPQVHLPIIRK